jgi:hypothetical protein
MREFYDVLAEVIKLLQREGRASHRALMTLSLNPAPGCSWVLASLVCWAMAGAGGKWWRNAYNLKVAAPHAGPPFCYVTLAAQHTRQGGQGSEGDHNPPQRSQCSPSLSAFKPSVSRGLDARKPLQRHPSAS